MKAPVHAIYIFHLLKAFPDALIVITHRNPNEVVASGCKLMELATNFHVEETPLTGGGSASAARG